MFLLGGICVLLSFIGLVPFIGGIWLLVLLVQPSVVSGGLPI